MPGRKGTIGMPIPINYLLSFLDRTTVKRHPESSLNQIYIHANAATEFPMSPYGLVRGSDDNGLVQLSKLQPL